MSQNNTRIPVKVESIEQLEASETLTQIASILKSLGIMPGKKTKKMINVTMPVAKKIIFYIVLAAMLVIGIFSILGSYYMTTTGFIASLILSTGSIGILFLCVYFLKGKIKYYIIAIDLIVAIAQVNYFVPSGLNRTGLAAQQKQMLQEEVTYADSIVTSLNTYVQMGKAINATAIEVADREQKAPGQIFNSATRIKNETKFLIDVKQGKLNVNNVMYEKINSLDDATKMRQILRDSIKKVSQPLIAAAKTLKTNASGWEQPLKAVVAQLEGLHSNELTVLAQVNDARMLYTADTSLLALPLPVYNYVYKAGDFKSDEKYTIIASVMEGMAVLFLVVLIALMYMEEASVDIQEAIKESKKTILTKLLVEWNIQPGNNLFASDFTDEALTTVLMWLENHKSMVKEMQQRRFTLEQFIQLYKEQPEELLLSIYDQLDAGEVPNFHVDELVHLPFMGDDNAEIVENMNLYQWRLLQQLVDKPEDVINHADTITKTWQEATGNLLKITDTSDAMFEFVYQNDDVAEAIKRYHISLMEFSVLYELYEEDELLDAVKANANFNLNHLRNHGASTRTRISADVLKKTTANNKAVIERYNIPVEKFILLDGAIMSGICEQIVALQGKIEDQTKRKDYVMQMTKDLTVFTLPMIQAWKALTEKPLEETLLLAISIDVLKNLNCEAVDDLFIVIDQFETEAAISIMKNWKMLYSSIIVKWQADEQLYTNAALIEILKKASMAGVEGLAALFASYQDAELEKGLLEEQDRKDLETRKKAAAEKNIADKKKDEATPRVAPKPAAPNSLLPLRGSGKKPEETPVSVPEVVAVSAVVVEDLLPVRKITLGIKLAQVSAATTPQGIMEVVSETFTVK